MTRNRALKPDRDHNGYLLAPWREIEVSAEVAAMVRPVIRCRLDWLRCYHEERPVHNGRTEVEYLAEYRTYRRKLTAIELSLADAYRVRWNVRAAMPTRLDWDGVQHTHHCRFTFVVDGVRVRFDDNKGLFWPELDGTNWREFA
jgi:hypothetical protein